MNEMNEARAGLCPVCRHARRVGSARGSVFLLCQLARSDPRFSKYPRQPVFECAGYAPGANDVAGADPASGRSDAKRTE